MQRTETLRWCSIVAVLVAAAPAVARDRWTELARGVRYLFRETRHRDGAPLRVHALYVDLCDPTVSLRVTAPDETRRRTSRWGRDVHAVAALNGDYFDPRSFRPLGPTRGGGRDFPPLPRYTFGGLLALRRGAPPTFFEPSQAPAPTIYPDVLPTQERVVHEGVVRLDPAIPHPGRRHPRSGFGLTRDGRTLFAVVVDGRSPSSAGVSTREYAELLRAMGAWEGLKLDGGGSSTLWLRGRGVVNRPSDGFERSVASHLGVLSDPTAPAGAPSYCPAPAP